MQDSINFIRNGMPHKRISGVYLYNVTSHNINTISFVFKSVTEAGTVFMFRFTESGKMCGHASSKPYYSGTLIRKATKEEVIKIMKLINQD